MDSYEKNRDKINEWKREYYKKNKNRLNERKREYRKKNKDKIREQGKKYHEKNKDRIKEYNKKNKDRIKNKAKEYYEKNKDNIKNYREKNKDRIKEQRREYCIKKYNISKRDYDNILLYQNNKCAICHDELNKSIRSPPVDHCHNSGKVRGILCHKCNTGLGFFKENPEILESAIRYLKS
jgi:hypothetical protein